MDMEQGRRTWFDASAYILFEATGDSEALESDPASETESGFSMTAEAEDDAQSCSYGSSQEIRSWPAREAIDDAVGDESDYDECGGAEGDGGECSEEEDGVVDQCRRRRRGETATATATKSAAREDPNLKAMCEKEVDRLFWEACLAS